MTDRRRFWCCLVRAILLGAWATHCLAAPSSDAAHRYKAWPATTVQLARVRLALDAPVFSTGLLLDEQRGSLRFPRADGSDWPADRPALTGPDGFALRVGQDTEGVRLLLRLPAKQVQGPAPWLRLRVSTDETLELPRPGWWTPTLSARFVDGASDCQALATEMQLACRAWWQQSQAQRQAVLEQFRREHVWVPPGGSRPRSGMATPTRVGLDSPMPPPEDMASVSHKLGAESVMVEWFLPWGSLPLTQHAPLSQILLSLHWCRSASDCESLLPVTGPGPEDAVRVRLATARPYRIGACRLPLLGLHRGQGQWLPAAYLPLQSTLVETVYTWAAPAMDLHNGVRGLEPSPQLWNWTQQSIQLGPDEFLCGPRVAWRRGDRRALGSVPPKPGALEPGFYCGDPPPVLAVPLDKAQARGRYWLVLEPPDCWFRRLGVGANAGEPGHRSTLWLLDRRKGRLRLLWKHQGGPSEALTIRHSGDLRRIELERWDSGKSRLVHHFCMDVRRLRMRACTARDPALPAAYPATRWPVTGLPRQVLRGWLALPGLKQRDDMSLSPNP